jgi:hypothetical protein
MIECAEMFLNGDGGRYLLGLLITDPAVLGFALPRVVAEGSALDLSGFLGQGGSSVVYSAGHPDGAVVVKCFHVHYQDRCRQEAETLNLLQAKVGDLCGKLVPSLVAHVLESNALVLRPVGIPFIESRDGATKRRGKTPMTLTHVTDLVATLRKVHNQAGVVHRDLCLHNMFDVNGHLLLNDWGCAAQIGQPILFSGAIQHASNRLLEASMQDEEYEPKPVDDLIMVWRCVQQSQNIRVCSLYGNTTAISVQQWWKTHSTGLDVEVLASLETAEDPYDILCQHLTPRFPLL